MAAFYGNRRGGLANSMYDDGQFGGRGARFTLAWSEQPQLAAFEGEKFFFDG